MKENIHVLSRLRECLNHCRRYNQELLQHNNYPTTTMHDDSLGWHLWCQGRESLSCMCAGKRDAGKALQWLVANNFTYHCLCCFIHRLLALPHDWQEVRIWGLTQHRCISLLLTRFDKAASCANCQKKIDGNYSIFQGDHIHLPIVK